MKNDVKYNFDCSPGIVAGGFVIGTGSGSAKAILDAVIQQEAEMLRDHYNTDVTIRYNSNGLSGGAFLVDSKESGIGMDSSIGLCAKLWNTRLDTMSQNERCDMSHEVFINMLLAGDAIRYQTVIDINRTINTVSPCSEHILIDCEYREFSSLEEASAYLMSNAIGLRAVG